MAREYRMRKRADASDRTRERIIRATMQLHDEKGVAPTTFSDIARRAGVGQATVSRYFPTLHEVVVACGGHVWMEMRPPTPDGAAAAFVGHVGTRARLVRLVDELDGFYERGAHRLALAARDRALVPALDGFLTAVDAGVEALVREALNGSTASETAIRLVTVMMSFSVWSQLRAMNLAPGDLSALKLRIARMQPTDCAWRIAECPALPDAEAETGYRRARSSGVGQPSTGRPALICSWRTASRVLVPRMPSMPPTS